ncbi:MAG: hypothetical protein ACE5GD_05685 [Candidatus Geothermarchaeales archaeon]
MKYRQYADSTIRGVIHHLKILSRITDLFNPEDVDRTIVEHDWNECPQQIEVIELRDLIGKLPKEG